MAVESLKTLDVLMARQALEQLYDHVVENNGRIVITKDSPDGSAAVLISLAELQALEKALAILSEKDDGIAMRDQVMRIASAAMAQTPSIAASIS